MEILPAFLLSFLVAYFKAYSSTLGGIISDLFLFYKSLKVVGPSFLKNEWYSILISTYCPGVNVLTTGVTFNPQTSKGGTNI